VARSIGNATDKTLRHGPLERPVQGKIIPNLNIMSGKEKLWFRRF
jgi:hypothetical protein